MTKRIWMICLLKKQASFIVTLPEALYHLNLKTSNLQTVELYTIFLY